MNESSMILIACYCCIMGNTLISLSLPCDYIQQSFALICTLTQYISGVFQMSDEWVNELLVRLLVLWISLILKVLERMKKDISWYL